MSPGRPSVSTAGAYSPDVVGRESDDVVALQVHMNNLTTADSRVRRLIAALQSGDAAQVEALCHPDMVVEDPESLSYGGTYRGFAGMCEVSAKLFAAVLSWQCETTRIIGNAGGDDCVLVQRMTGRSANNGRAIDMSILEHYTFRDGLLISIRPYYWDTKAMIDLLSEK
jgi:ketosteroid isomerase-like protein